MDGRCKTRERSRNGSAKEEGEADGKNGVYVTIQ